MDASTHVDGSYSRYQNEAGAFLTRMDEVASQMQLDYSVDSLQRLEQFIAEHFDPPGTVNVDESLIFGIGCYYGEVIVRHLGGYWNEEDQPEINGLGPGTVAAIQPIEKARHRFQSGPAASLSWAYHSLVKQVYQENQQNAPPSSGGVLGLLKGLFKK